MHPTREIIVSGSGRSLYMWCPVPDPDAPDTPARDTTTTTDTAGWQLGFGSPWRAGASPRSFDAAPGSGEGGKKGKGASAKKGGGGGSGAKRKAP
jgi:hypothetical protein